MKKCCADCADAVLKMSDVVLAPVRRRAAVPAENKWGSIDPMAILLTVLLSLHNILLRAEMEMVGLKMGDSEYTDDDDDAPAAALPTEPDVRKENRRRARKMRLWLCDAMSLLKLLAWSCDARHVMSLHWRLFKAGTLHSQKSSNGHTAFFNLLSLARSPALKLLAELHA